MLRGPGLSANVHRPQDPLFKSTSLEQFPEQVQGNTGLTSLTSDFPGWFRTLPSSYIMSPSRL